MKIVYCGNRTNLASDGKSFNTENHIALTLEKLGHEVVFLQENRLPLGWQNMTADIFIWQRTWTGIVTEHDLRQIESRGIKTVSFHLDKYAGIKRDGGMGVGSAFWKTQYVFSPENSPEARRIFQEYGINQHYLPPAVFEDECYIAEPVDKFQHDIVFVGGGEEYAHPEWPYRGKLVRWLRETYGDRFVKYGGPDGTIRGTELNQLYSSSKVVIGDSLCKDFMDTWYWSDRLTEVIGRGGFIIHPYIAGITESFTDRKEAVYYSYDNFTQLKNLIDYYLEHDDEREAIRIAGNARCKLDHTYTNRMKRLLEIINE